LLLTYSSSATCTLEAQSEGQQEYRLYATGDERDDPVDPDEGN